MNRMQDPFPRTPERFHLRVEQTLDGLRVEREDAILEFRGKNRRRRIVVLAAALLIVALAATAVAVVRGNALKKEFEGTAIVDEVQPVFVESTEDGFGVSLDEAVCVGRHVYVSYTVSVPEDGNVYLYGLHDIRLNGEPDRISNVIDNDGWPTLYAAGGEYGSRVTRVLSMDLPGSLGADEAERNLEMTVAFMETDRKLERTTDSDAFYAMTADTPDGDAKLFESSETLYYFDTSVSDNPSPVIYMIHYPEVYARYEEKRALALEETGETEVEELSQEAREQTAYLTVQDLEETGIVKRIAERTLQAPLSVSDQSEVVYNDVKQHVYSMDGFELEIESVSIGYFEATLNAVIRMEGGVAEVWSESEPYAQSYGLYKKDGSEIYKTGGYFNGFGPQYAEDGTREYSLEFHTIGILDPESLSELMLVPEEYDMDSGFGGMDTEDAILLELVYNPDIPDATPEPTDDPAEYDDISS